jgi:hypothetical protein
MDPSMEPLMQPVRSRAERAAARGGISAPGLTRADQVYTAAVRGVYTADFRRGAASTGERPAAAAHPAAPSGSMPSGTEQKEGEERDPDRDRFFEERPAAAASPTAPIGGMPSEATARVEQMKRARTAEYLRLEEEREREWDRKSQARIRAMRERYEQEDREFEEREREELELERTQRGASTSQQAGQRNRQDPPSSLTPPSTQARGRPTKAKAKERKLATLALAAMSVVSSQECGHSDTETESSQGSQLRRSGRTKKKL